MGWRNGRGNGSSVPRNPSPEDPGDPGGERKEGPGASNPLHPQVLQPRPAHPLPPWGAERKKIKSVLIVGGRQSVGVTAPQSCLSPCLYRLFPSAEMGLGRHGVLARSKGKGMGCSLLRPLLPKESFWLPWKILLLFMDILNVFFSLLNCTGGVGGEGQGVSHPEEVQG